MLHVGEMPTDNLPFTHIPLFHQQATSWKRLHSGFFQPASEAAHIFTTFKQNYCSEGRIINEGCYTTHDVNKE